MTGAAGSYSLVDAVDEKPTRFDVNPSIEWQLSAVLKDFREPEDGTDDDLEILEAAEPVFGAHDTKEADEGFVVAGVLGGRKALCSDAGRFGTTG